MYPFTDDRVSQRPTTAARTGHRPLGRAIYRSLIHRDGGADGFCPKTELFDWYSLQHSPLVNAGDIYGDGDAWYFFIYPNTMLNIMPGRMQTNRIIPLGIDRCRVDFDYYYGADGAPRNKRDLEFSDEIQQEDISICEAVQKGLASGAYTPGLVSPKRESGVWHFQNLLRRAYGADVNSE